jgi:hypothetical protein
MKKMNYKIGLIIGAALIITAIIIGIILNNDIAFIFAGIGIVITGISTLAYINKKQ